MTRLVENSLAREDEGRAARARLSEQGDAPDAERLLRRLAAYEAFDAETAAALMSEDVVRVDLAAFTEATMPGVDLFTLPAQLQEEMLRTAYDEARRRGDRS